MNSLNKYLNMFRERMKELQKALSNTNISDFSLFDYRGGLISLPLLRPYRTIENI
jgi:hypothetical protein